jgi:dUTPase
MDQQKSTTIIMTIPSNEKKKPKDVVYRINMLTQPITFSLGVKSKMPTRLSPKSAKLILYSNENAWIFPSSRKFIKTGLKVDIPMNYCGQIISIPQISIRNNVHVITTVIDEDYEDEIKVLMINNGYDVYEIEVNQPIAFLVLTGVSYANPSKIPYFEEYTMFKTIRKNNPKEEGYVLKDGGYHCKKDNCFYKAIIEKE